MANTELTPEQIASLLAPKLTKLDISEVDARDPLLGQWIRKFRQAPNFNSLSGRYITWTEPPHGRCLSRRCGVSTPYKVQGAYLCTVHALIKLGEMLDFKDDYVPTQVTDWGTDVTDNNREA